jgi:hypothetical protein
VDIREYENLVSSTYALLEEEYGTMNEIRDMIALSEQRLQEEERARGQLDEEMKKARRDIAIIRRNIIDTIDEQKQVILERHSLAQIYKEMIEDSFALSLARVYNFEQEILVPLEKCREETILRLWQLLNPLLKPSLDKNLSLLPLYDRQARIRNEDDTPEGVTLEELQEDQEWMEINRINEAQVALVHALLKMAGSKGSSFRFSDFYAYLESQEELFTQVVQGELLFKSMLKLYDLKSIDILAWQKEHDEVVANATGELDLNYCLHRIAFEQPDMYGVSRIHITKPDEEMMEEDVSYTCNGAVYSRHILISNFLIEVDMV